MDPVLKTTRIQMRDLTERLRYLENEHMKLNDPNTLNQIQEAKQKLNSIYEEEIEKKAPKTTG